MTLHVCPHPIVEHKLTRLRDEDSPPALFRHLTSEITQVLIVEATADLPGILKKALDGPGVHLIEVPVDYSENERVLIEELNALTAKL